MTEAYRILQEVRELLLGRCYEEDIDVAYTYVGDVLTILKNKEENDMTIRMTMEKATKNTIRFTEVLESELDAPKLGTVYVPKSTLGELGWKEGDTLEISVDAVK